MKLGYTKKKRAALCKALMDSYIATEEQYWEILDSLSLDAIDGHDSTDQFLMHYCRKLDELIELMDEYKACFEDNE
jgi:hypothetical protein